MSATGELTRFYGSFFYHSAQLAICPYKLTLTAFGDRPEDLLLGVVACIGLSIVVPILPSLTSITFAVALCMASIAVASMFITYPIAILVDALSCNFSSERNPGFAF